uniref:Uncharacterized protein n=1 Tax=Davidia involucrata TaxID=16924 RepID=A0A5B7BDR9_DAVIN
MDLKVDLNIPIHQGAFPLHEAAYSLSPGLIELFLSHGAQPDSRCDHVDSEYYGLLPLHIALKRLSSDKNLIQWTPSQSIVELIIMLCLPKMEEALETTRLLALNTKEIEEVIRFYAKRGKVTDLAVLLMVARKKFMDPITLLDKDGFTLKGCMTFRRCIRSELAALINIEYGIMGLNEEEELFEVCRERKMVMMSTLLMLEIFERAGDAIDEYLQSKQSNKSEEQVAQEVASLLAEAGFDTDSRDIGDRRVCRMWIWTTGYLYATLHPFRHAF